MNRPTLNEAKALRLMEWLESQAPDADAIDAILREGDPTEEQEQVLDLDIEIRRAVHAIATAIAVFRHQQPRLMSDLSVVNLTADLGDVIEYDVPKVAVCLGKYKREEHEEMTRLWLPNCAASPRTPDARCTEGCMCCWWRSVYVNKSTGKRPRNMEEYRARAEETEKRIMDTATAVATGDNVERVATCLRAATSSGPNSSRLYYWKAVLFAHQTRGVTRCDPAEMQRHLAFYADLPKSPW